MQHLLTEQRLSELESRLTFQESTIDTLNKSVSQHELEMTKLRMQMQLLIEKIRLAIPSVIAHESEETLPPHY